MSSILGILPANLWQLLKDNQYGVDRHLRVRFAFLVVKSYINLHYKRIEDKNYAQAIEATKVSQAPLFILGHWRSGTSWLHSLIALDQQFAYPNLLEVYNPYTFFTIEKKFGAKLEKIGSQKRPMDNMEVTATTAAEDEFALAIMSRLSPLHGWAFPRREAHYDRYLTFDDVSKAEREEWKVIFLYLLKKLTCKYNRRLVLKSPQHTGRIKLILELFPNAQFVHLHRDPYTLFQSTHRLYEKTVPEMTLQNPECRDVVGGILKRYKSIYQAFFRDRALIPAGNYYEMAYEDLEKDPVEQVEKIYQNLNLRGLESFRSELQNFIAGSSDYKKTQHIKLDPGLRQRIAQEWRMSFKEWGYQA